MRERTFARVQRVAGESRRTRAPETAVAVVARRVLAARRPRTLVHVAAPGAVRVPGVPVGALAVVTAREVGAQRPGAAGVRQAAFVDVGALSKNNTARRRLGFGRVARRQTSQNIR